MFVQHPSDGHFYWMVMFRGKEYLQCCPTGNLEQDTVDVSRFAFNDADHLQSFCEELSNYSGGHWTVARVREAIRG